MTCPHSSTQDLDGVRWCDDCRTVVDPWPAVCLACGATLPSAGRTLAWHTCDPTYRILLTPASLVRSEDGPPLYVHGLREVHGHLDGKTLVVARGPLRGHRLRVPTGVERRPQDLDSTQGW